MNQFLLRINLKNEDVSTMEDVARELRKIADIMDRGLTNGPIRDAKLNIVGTFDYTRDDPDDNVFIG